MSTAHRAVWAALVLVACTSKAPTPSLDQKPHTDTIEGHGGIAVAPMAPPRPAAPDLIGRPEPIAAPVEAESTVESPPADAQELFYRAYALRGVDPAGALRMFREVVAQTPPDAELHQKALRQIDLMPPK